MHKDPAGMSKISIIVAVIAITIAIAALMVVTSPSVIAPSGDGQTEGTAPSAQSSAGTRNLALSYTEALNLYGEYRIQFSNCSGTPGTLNVASGATLLLDNRDAVAHTIKIGSQTYSVGAYGFRIVSATKGEHQITCDGKGAAILNVQ